MLRKLITLLRFLDKLLHGPDTIEGGNIVFIVKDDNPDVRYELSPTVVKDAEGNVIPGAVATVEVTSTDPAVVQVTPDADPSTGGTLHFGNPGVASLNAQASFGGLVLASKGAQFTVTVGDPASIAGGDISIPGLTEATEPAPAPPA